MNVLKFRVVIDLNDDVFRDIAIRADQTFEELYDAIVAAFKFQGGVMSSFYMSNENWDKGLEITLLDMSEGGDGKNTMKNCILNDYVLEDKQRMILVYDFMRMWCFYLELIEESTASAGTKYPIIALQFGEAPLEESKEMDFVFEGDDASSGISDEELFGGDDDDEEGPENLDDEIGGMFNDLDSYGED